MDNVCKGVTPMQRTPTESKQLQLIRMEKDKVVADIEIWRRKDPINQHERGN